MSLKEELKEAVSKIIHRDQWTVRDGNVVPEPDGLGLDNDARRLQATVLYADMQSSTLLVDSLSPTRAAEVYKSYMVCAARLIKHHGGAVTAYDGDRIMAVFRGETKNTDAAKAALRINWALLEIVNPANERQYGEKGYELKHVIGIDTSAILACRIGVRNENDIVWVGRAANYAAKLCTINSEYPIYITGDVFAKLNESWKRGPAGEAMWEKRSWTPMNGMTIYRSNWQWSL